ncbi:MAG: ECF-type sigma factor [Planctomycetaceae bacterium]
MDTIRVEPSEHFSTEQLLPLVYDELRRLAARKMQLERPDLTIQSTALVHEAYLRLTQGAAPPYWRDQLHFISAFAQAMRRVLVESARRRAALKRGANATRRPLEAAEPDASSAEEILALDESLDRLSRVDPQKADVVRLRYFTGLTIPEIAEALGISPRTADRHWAYARAWLLREMGQERAPREDSVA